MPERELTDEDLAKLEDAAARNHPDAPEREISPDELAALTDAASRVHVAAPPPPPKAEDPGAWDALWRSVGAGSMKQGLDELTGEIAQLVTGRGLSPDDKNEIYRRARDRQRALLEAGREAHPVLSFLGNMAGDVGSDFLLSKAGVPVTSTPYQTAVGAISGLLGSKAELTSDKGTPADALRAGVDTATGAGLAYAIPKLGSAIARSRVGQAVGARFRDALENIAANTGRRVLQSGSDIAARTEPLPKEAVLQALEDKAIPYFGTTQGAYKRLEDLAETRGANYGAILKELEDMGFQGPEVEALAQKMTERAQQEALTIGSKQPARVAKVAAEDLRNIARGGDALTRTVGPEREALGMLESETLKRKLQNEARWGLLSDTPVNEVKKGLSSDVRQGIEDAIEQQAAEYPVGSAEREVADSFVPAKQQLAKTIAARDVAEVGTSRIAKRGSTNLKDVIVSGALSGGSPAQLLLNQAGMSLLRSRAPSTLAQAAYRLSRGGANDAVSAGARAALHQPETIQALTDWLAGDDKQQRRQALLQALSQEQNP